jgi:hypothetical protein
MPFLQRAERAKKKKKNIEEKGKRDGSSHEKQILYFVVTDYEPESFSWLASLPLYI